MGAYCYAMRCDAMLLCEQAERHAAEAEEAMTAAAAATVCCVGRGSATAGRTQRHERRKAGLAALVAPLADSEAPADTKQPRAGAALEEHPEASGSEDEYASLDGSFHAVNATHVARTQLALASLSVRDRLAARDGSAN